MDKITWHIYALKDPRTQQMRYVGQTKDPRRRVKSHMSESRRTIQRTHKNNWLCELATAGLWPEVQILETGHDDQWANAERRWIAELRTQGCPLINRTDGGEGTLGLRALPETRAKMSTAAKARAMRPEGKAHLSNAGRAPHPPRTPEQIAKQAQINRERQHKRSLEFRRRLSEVKRGIKQSAEARAKKSAALRGIVRSPETRARMSAAKSSPELCQRLSELFKGKKRSPETVAKMKAAWAKRRINEVNNGR